VGGWESWEEAAGQSGLNLGRNGGEEEGKLLEKRMRKNSG
jgi:hypothetical protein